MFTVLMASNHYVLSCYTPYFVDTLYAIFLTLETPLSGMSMNPAQTFGSAFQGRYCMPFGFIPWPPLSACWLLPNCFFRCTAASTRTVPSSITPMTSGVYFVTAPSGLDLRESILATMKSASKP
jgi:hypothetical protein